MVIYSHSRLSTFEQCKLRYKYRYIDKIVPEIEKTIEAHLGSMVHKTLEWLYGEVRKGRVPTIDQVIVYYSKSWLEDYEEVLIPKKGMTDKDYFDKGVMYLLNYYNRYTPFNHEKTLELEKQIFLDLDESGNHKITGFIDRLAYNMQTGEYEIHDYKTSGTMPSQDKIDNDRQLALYSIAVREMFPDITDVKLIWHYLFFNKRIESRRTEEQLQQLKEETVDLIRTIESTQMHEFTPNVTTLCNWCPYKPICPAWNPGGAGRKPGFERQQKLF